MFTQTTYAQLAVSNIPKELLSRANATIRDYNQIIHIKAPDEVIETGNKIITIHNEASLEYGIVLFYYDKSTQIKEIKGEILDANGNQLKKFSLKDFEDKSSTDQSTLFDDYRIKKYSPIINEFPFTVSYTYTIKREQNLVLSQWRPDYRNDVSIEKCTFKIIASPTEKLRINTKNYVGEPEITSTPKDKTYLWKVENLAASRYEPFSPTRQTNGIVIQAVPEQFQYFKKKGEVSDWKSFGLWMNETLLKDKRILSDATKAKVVELTKDIKTDKEKAKAIYEYMQNKTRYISVQIGIGGFEPFPAESVDRLGYGDCKALVNYMQALLEAVNIPSYYCIVEAGDRKVDVDAQFANIADGNHIILCLPFKNDTTWLECTSQDAPFGYLGNFTDDRLVLACTPEGGKIMRTAVYKYDENLQHRKANLKLDKLGKITGHLETKFYGTQFKNHFENHELIKDKQIKNLKEWYTTNRINFNDIEYSIEDTSKLHLTEKLNIDISDYGVISGSSMSLMPNIFNRTGGISDIRNRKNPVKIFRGFTDIDEIEIELPENVVPFIVPKKSKLDAPMANYEISIEIKDKKMICYRKLQLKEGEYPVESYANFVELMTEANLLDGTKYTLQLKDKN